MDSRCFKEHLDYILCIASFDYITLVIEAAIILISFFGNIKEDYKWLCLNQTIFHVFVSLYFKIYNDYIVNIHKINTVGRYFYVDFATFINDSLPIILCLNLFLFIATRFVAIAFPLYYNFKVQGRRIFYIILIYDVFIIVYFLIFALIYHLFFRNKNEMHCWLYDQHYKNNVENCNISELIYISLQALFSLIIIILLSLCVLASSYTFIKVTLGYIIVKNSQQRSINLSKISISFAIFFIDHCIIYTYRRML